MKPFNLEEALAGKPLVHKQSGKKAYLVGESKFFPLYSVIEFSEKVIGIGYHSTTLTDTIGDYFGMWEEKSKRIINGIEVPEPVTEETWVDGNCYWHVSLGTPTMASKAVFCKASQIDRLLIARRVVFETEEGAEAMAKALFNYKME